MNLIESILLKIILQEKMAIMEIISKHNKEINGIKNKRRLLQNKRDLRDMATKRQLWTLDPDLKK